MNGRWKGPQSFGSMSPASYPLSCGFRLGCGTQRRLGKSTEVGRLSLECAVGACGTAEAPPKGSLS